MDLNHVAVFVRVVELESFTAAAEQLGLPKSSVSRTVTRLEEELGVRLLQRTTRTLHLTEAGHAYYERARVALSNLEEAATAASDTSGVPRGTVRVTAPVDVGMLNLSNIVARFVLAHPLVHIDISFTSRRVDLVAEGFDLAIRAGKLTDSTLVARKVGSTTLGLFASQAYVDRRGQPRSLAELSQHECVLMHAKNGQAEWRLSGPAGEESVTVHGPLNVDDMLFVQQGVEEGVGIGLLPVLKPKRCEEHRRAPEPVRILPEYELVGAGLHVVSPPTRFQAAAVAVFREFLTNELVSQWPH